MTDEELKEQFASVMPAEFTEKHQRRTYQYFREINGHSYEQIAVLMAMQHQMVEELLQKLNETEKEKRQKAVTGLVKATQMPRRRFINGD